MKKKTRKDRDYEDLFKAYYDVFNTPQGEIVLEDLYNIAFRNSPDATKPDPYRAVYMAAQLAMVTTIENRISQHNERGSE